MKMKKEIIVNWKDIKSIERAEKQKARLENEGYTFIKTEKISFIDDIDKSIYEKKCKQ